MRKKKKEKKGFENSITRQKRYQKYFQFEVAKFPYGPEKETNDGGYGLLCRLECSFNLTTKGRLGER